jgi:hypothetical protein
LLAAFPSAAGYLLDEQKTHDCLAIVGFGEILLDLPGQKTPSRLPAAGRQRHTHSRIVEAWTLCMLLNIDVINQRARKKPEAARYVKAFFKVESPVSLWMMT